MRLLIFFNQLKLRAKGSKTSLLLLSIFAIHTDVYASTLPIYIVEIIPQHSEEYSVNQEVQHIEKGIELALSQQLKQLQCRASVTKIIKKGSDETLAQVIHSIKQNTPNAIVLGLSRSNSARLAAKLAQGSQITGISVGSSAGHLKQINPLFFSIASPLESQWKLIAQEIKSLHCHQSNTLGVFNPRSYFSVQFRDHFTREHRGKVFDLKPSQDLKPHSLPLDGKKCIFFGTYLSDAELIAKDILESTWSGHLIANTDWTYFPRELHKFLLSQSEHLQRVSIPTGWTKGNTMRSNQFAHHFRKLASMEATPAAAYAYDAAILAAQMACRGLKLNHATKDHLDTLPLIREYEGTSPSGHFVSEVFFYRK